MARKQDLSKYKSLAGFKDSGVTDIRREDDNHISLVLDTSKIASPTRKKNLANGLTKATAASDIYNSPFAATFYEGYVTGPHYQNEHEKMRLAMRYFKMDPMAGRIIELMKTLAMQGFHNQHPDQKTTTWFNQWCERVNMDKILGWIFLDYFRTGNVLVWREMGPFKQLEIDRYDYAIAAKKNTWTKKQIPLAYTVFNPLCIQVEECNGDLDKLSMVSEQILWRNNREVFSKIEQSLMDPHQDSLQRILRMRQPYEPYGHIMMERAFGALHEKNKLRQMDLSTVNSMINQLVKVTIGNNEFPAGPRQLKSLADAFKNVGKSQTIFWNHTLDIEILHPDSKILNKDKYDRVDEDIRNAFGISEILMGNGGKIPFAAAYISLKSFLANIQDARNEIKMWLKGQYEDIAEALEFDSYPEPEFDTLSLTDEVAEKGLVLQAFDRGLCSFEEAQTKLGFSAKLEKARKEKELPLIEKGVLVAPASPYHTAQQNIQQDNPNGAKPVKVDKPGDNKQAPEAKAENKSVKGLEGRPKTAGGGSYPARRKPATASDQVEFDFIASIKADPKKEVEVVSSIARETMAKLNS